MEKQVIRLNKDICGIIEEIYQQIYCKFVDMRLYR